VPSVLPVHLLEGTLTNTPIVHNLPIEPARLKECRLRLGLSLLTPLATQEAGCVLPGATFAVEAVGFSDSK
jgi:hypothetical protein